MAFLQTQIDSESKLYNALMGRYFSESSTLLTVPQIKEIDKTTGKLIETFAAVFYPEAPEDFHPILATSKQGALDRIYGPILCKADGQVVLSAGLINYVMAPVKGVVKHPTLEIEVDVVSTRFNGYDDTPVLSVSLYNEAQDLTLAYNFPLKLRKLEKEEKYPSTKELSTMIKRKPADLLAWLGDPPKANMKTIAAKQLPPDEYEVVGYEFFTTKDGRESCVLQIKGKVDPESGLNTQEYIDPADDSRETYIPLEEIAVYAPPQVQGALKLQPVVSPEYPALFTVRSVTPGKKANSFRVDSGFLLNKDAPQVDQGEEEDISFLDLMLG